MISKNTLKQYQQLQQKKFRQKYGLFIVEGIKSVKELLNSSYRVEHIVCTDKTLLDSIDNQDINTSVLSNKEFSKISNLKSPQAMLAIVKMKEQQEVKSNWNIVLDDIRDPGNLGTIIRIADWYGIANVICSPDTAELYNPKVIQASMGSFLRVNVIYTELKTYLKGKKVFATLLEGENIREIKKQDSGWILIGNEANGIRKEVLESIEYYGIHIPASGGAESLNAAVATAVCCERLLF